MNGQDGVGFGLAATSYNPTDRSYPARQVVLARIHADADETE